jgi:hypothetical protein
MKYLIYLFTLPSDLFNLVLGTVIRLFFGKVWYMEGMALAVVLHRESAVYRWASTTLPGWAAITLGHLIVYAPRTRQRVAVHEHVHVAQFQAAQIFAFIIGLLVYVFTAKIALSYFIWSTGFLVYMLASVILALLKGKPAYMGLHTEEHAYAVAALSEQGKTTNEDYLNY